MKLQKYSLQQLSAAYKTLLPYEAKAMVGGYVEIGGGYVQLTEDEMRTVFGEIESLPGIALNGNYFQYSSDPFGSYSGQLNGFYVDPDAQSNQWMDDDMRNWINSLLENYTYETSTLDGLVNQSTFIVPISALGGVAETWHLDSGIGSIEYSSTDPNSNAEQEFYTEIATQIIWQISSIAGVASSSLQEVKSNLIDLLEDAHVTDSSQITISIERDNNICYYTVVNGNAVLLCSHIYLS